MATIKDLNVKARVNILCTEIQDKGDANRRPGRDGTQRKIILELPEIEVDSEEFEARLTAAQLALQGCWVDDEPAPIAITDDATNITHESATLNGTIISNDTSADSGFQIGLTKELGTTVFATESPVQNADSVPITYNTLLAPNTKYYYRAFADQYAGWVMYGRVKSFTTDHTPAP
jgi:hypothetical protein